MSSLKIIQIFLSPERTKARLLDKNEYVNKMEQILADNDTYQVPKNPSKKIINDLRKLISKWKKNFIDDFT